MHPGRGADLDPDAISESHPVCDAEPHADAQSDPVANRDSDAGRHPHRRSDGYANALEFHDGRSVATLFAPARTRFPHAGMLG